MKTLITVLLCVVRCTDVTVTSKAMFYLLECICNGQNLDIHTHNQLVGNLKMKMGGWGLTVGVGGTQCWFYIGPSRGQCPWTAPHNQTS